jgi:endothelin-converting enzyme/putative endopeptidase
MKFRGILALSVVLGVSLNLTAQSSPQAGDQRGVVLENIDHSVKPGDDFYLYANGEWMRRTEIPPDRASMGGFAIVGGPDGQAGGRNL